MEYLLINEAATFAVATVSTFTGALDEEIVNPPRSSSGSSTDESLYRLSRDSEESIE